MNESCNVNERQYQIKQFIISAQCDESTDHSKASYLRQLQLHGTSDGFHGFHLSGGTDARNGQTHVDGGANTCKWDVGNG